MKKLIPILLALALFVSACQPGSGRAVPTAIALPTAFPTNTPPAINPTAEVNAGGEAGSERVSSVDGMPEVYIPDGSFRMGGLDVDAQIDETPAHNVTLKGFWMDKLEVTNAMYALCVQAGACEPPQFFKSGTRDSYFNNAEFDDYPVVYVTWAQADNYCKWTGRRLPTEAEWERAARGDDLRNFPWGDELPNAYNSNSLNIVGDTSRVGSYAEGASPFGALDMAGNVWEWVADRYRPDYYGKSADENPSGPSKDEVFNELRVIRGGSFQDDWVILRLANRSYLDGPNPKAQPTDEVYYGRSSVQIGFRCAADH